MFDLVGLGIGSYGVCYKIVQLVGWGMDVAGAISLVMGIVGGGGILVATAIKGLEYEIYKKGAKKAALW